MDADWLTARTAADDAARARTESTLLPVLVTALRSGPAATGGREDADRVIRMIDVGAGSGANQRWLAPRLPFRQRWVHLDHDPAILGHTHAVVDTDSVVDTRLVVGGIDELAALISTDRTPTVITCAAVLDVLIRSDVDLLCGLIAAHRVPALLSLSVTGTVRHDPEDPLDQALLDAFNAHQRRDGRAGPDAPALVRAFCAAAGVRVLTVPTPWVLDRRSDPGFVARFLSERVAAAIEQDPSRAASASAWLERRLSSLDRESVTVDHEDLLILP